MGNVCWLDQGGQGEECGLKPKEIKKVNLKYPFVPFVSLFTTKVWLREESLSMLVWMAEAEGSGRLVASALGWFTMVTGTVYIRKQCDLYYKVLWYLYGGDKIAWAKLWILYYIFHQVSMYSIMYWITYQIMYCICVSISCNMYVWSQMQTSIQSE